MLGSMNMLTPTSNSTTRMAIDKTLDGFAALSRVQSKQTVDDVSLLTDIGPRGSHSAAMTPLPEVFFEDFLIRKVQETLDELFSKGQLPFRLTAYDVKELDIDEYTVPFHDSRIRSITFTLETGVSFKQVIRSAVLQRVRAL
jgi:hypothetical protein